MAQLSSRLTLDGTQHNQALNDAVKQVAQYEREVKSANAQLNTFQKSIGSATGSIRGMMSSFSSGDITGFITNARSLGTAITAMIPASASAQTAITGLGTALKTALGPVGLAAAGIGALIGISAAAIKKTQEFQASVKGFSALTGLTGGALNDMGSAAIDMSRKYGTAASEVVDSMKMIGSQAPQLLQDMQAMRSVTESAMVLSRAADGMTIEDTARAITSVMNQMNVAASEANGIINSLAAGAQRGAADINYLATAIQKSGAQAAEAGMTYQQAIAAIETIAPRFASAEVAGTALNSVLVRLTTQSRDEFNPAVVGIEKALDALAAANLSAADKVQLFGQAGLLAGNTLIQQRDALHDMTTAVTGTNTAYDQMSVKSGQLSQLWDKLKSSWDALLLAIGDSYPVKLLGLVLAGVIQSFKLTIDVITNVLQVMNRGTNTLIAFAQALYKRVLYYWNLMVNAITDTAVYRTVAGIFQKIYTTVSKIIGKIQEMWQRFLAWLGMEQQTEVKVRVDTTELEDIGIDPTKQESKLKTTATVKFDTGSIDYYKQRLNELQEMLTRRNLVNVDVSKVRAEIDRVKREIERQEIVIGVRAQHGSLEDLDARISEIDTKIKQLNPTVDRAEIMQLQIDRDALESARKQVEAAIDGVTVTGRKFSSQAELGSLQYAQDRVSYYKTQVQMAVVGTEDYEYWTKQLEYWTSQEHEIKLRVEEDTTNLKSGTLEALEHKRQQWEAVLKTTVIDTPEYNEAISELKDITSQEQEIRTRIEMDKTGMQPGSLGYIQQQISNLKSRIEVTAYGTPEYRQMQEQLHALEHEEHKIQVKVDVDNLSQFDKIQTITGAVRGLDSVVSSFSNLISKIDEGANAWEIFIGAVDAVDTTLTTLHDTIEMVEMVQAMLAQTTAQTTATQQAAAAASSATTAQELANTAAVTSAKSGEAIASATASGARMPFPFNIAAIAAAVAAVIAALAMISRFAGGGIVHGRSTVGDMNLARVNSGEMILNTRQQTRLFHILDGSQTLQQPGAPTVSTVRIKGSDLYLALHNYANIQKMSGKNIGLR